MLGFVPVLTKVAHGGNPHRESGISYRSAIMLRSIQITLQFISHSISFSFKISRDHNQNNTIGLLYEQLENALLPRMIILEPLRLLYEWIEDNKTYTDRSDGIRFIANLLIYQHNFATD